MKGSAWSGCREIKNKSENKPLLQSVGAAAGKE